MDITASAAISYLPVRDVVTQRAGGERVAAAAPRGDPAFATDRRLAADSNPRESETTAARAVRDDQATREAEKPSGFLFEYENNVQVMKVQDSKGVLIYQVPSKGQLALIAAEDESEPQLSRTA